MRQRKKSWSLCSSARSQKCRGVGRKNSKGSLFVNPPGIGKTVLAKATASEFDVPSPSIFGSNFMEMFVGVGPSKARNLFQEAR